MRESGSYVNSHESEANNAKFREYAKDAMSRSIEQMSKVFMNEDLNAVIRQHSEWLANQLHSQRESLFPPDAEKTMRKFTSGEAASLLSVNDSYLRKLNLVQCVT